MHWYQIGRSVGSGLSGIIGMILGVLLLLVVLKMYDYFDRRW